MKTNIKEKIFKNFSVAETKVADGTPRTLVVKITTPTPDRSQDVVEPKGMNSDNFMKNPIVLFAHNYGELPIAKCTNLKIMDDGVMATVQFPEKGMYPKADTVYEMYKGGYLNAWSVGFMPSGEDAYMENEQGGYTFKSWELLEFSSVPVPANAEALTVMRSKGLNVDALNETKKLEVKKDADNPEDPGYTDDTKITDLNVKQLKNVIDEALDAEETEEDTDKSAKAVVEKDVEQVLALSYALDCLNYFIGYFEDSKVNQKDVDKLKMALGLVMEVVKNQAELGKKSFTVAKVGRTISAKHEALLTECIDHSKSTMKNIQSILDTVAEEDDGKSIKPTGTVLAGLVASLKQDLKKTDKDVGLALRTLKLFSSGKGGENK